MALQAHVSARAVSRPGRWSSERLFYTGFAVAIAAGVVLGFARTFFFRAWYPEWARVHGAPETFFYIHGTVFAAWLLLLIAQTSLVGAGRVDLHRRLGVLGAGLAVAIVLLGAVGALMAASRPTGFIDVPVPPLQFLVIPFAALALFVAFVSLAFVNRRRPQSHKRLMLLAAIALAEAGVARWPFAFMATPTADPRHRHDRAVPRPVPRAAPGLGPRLPRPAAPRHAVGRAGADCLAAVPVLAHGHQAWLAFAGWAVSLLPG